MRILVAVMVAAAFFGLAAAGQAAAAPPQMIDLTSGGCLVDPIGDDPIYDDPEAGEPLAECTGRQEASPYGGDPGVTRVKFTLVATCAVAGAPAPPESNAVYVAMGGRIEPVIWRPCSGDSALPFGQIYQERRVFRRSFSTGPGPRRVRVHSVRAFWGELVVGYQVRIRRYAFLSASRRVIYDSNFDDYFNVCVKEGLDVRASGGRLYCVERFPASAEVVATIRQIGDIAV